MGYSVCRFPGGVDQNLMCGICGGVLEDAVLTPCGHSFCALCLSTWLARPKARSCPECREDMSQQEAHPIRSVRNLVNSLAIRCDNEEHGCDALVTLDSMQSHRLRDCGYEQMQCAGCCVSLNRRELRAHHNACEIIQRILKKEGRALDACNSSNKANSEGEEEESDKDTFTHDTPEKSNVRQLFAKVSVLETHLKRVRLELDKVDSHNKKMEKDLKRTRDELVDKRCQLNDYICSDFDNEYEYGFTQSSIRKLSCFMSRFINCMPQYIDTERLFLAVKRCYENFGHSGEVAEHDVLLLLTTAYASNWFTRAQRISIHCWLQSLMKYRAYSSDVVPDTKTAMSS